MKSRFGIWILFIVILIFCACGSNRENPMATKLPKSLKAGSNEILKLSLTDYSDMGNWLKFGGDNKKADIFIVYPTCTYSEDEADRPYARLDNREMRASAAWWLSFHLEIFEEANIYMPFYRQVNGAMSAKMSSAELIPYVNNEPREDIFAAFDYYLKTVNKGERPFILFGHSQGGQLVKEIAAVFLGNEKYYEYNKNHIAAYAIGCPVLSSEIEKNPNLKFSENKDDTGVMLSWNTVAPSEVESGAYKNFITWMEGSLVTNPISWTANEILAHAKDNKASITEKEDGSVGKTEAYANAIVDKEHSLLVTTTANENKYVTYSPEISKYHVADISFFYYSIKENIANRISNFANK